MAVNLNQPSASGVLNHSNRSLLASGGRALPLPSSGAHFAGGQSPITSRTFTWTTALLPSHSLWMQAASAARASRCNETKGGFGRAATTRAVRPRSDGRTAGAGRESFPFSTVGGAPMTRPAVVVAWGCILIGASVSGFAQSNRESQAIASADVLGQLSSFSYREGKSSLALRGTS